MSIDTLYAHLCRQARRSGQHQAANLSGGARVAVAVRDGWTALTFSRPDKPLGAREITIFEQACAVPPGARRIPDLGQRQIAHDGHTWNAVSFVWRDA